MIRVVRPVPDEGPEKGPRGGRWTSRKTKAVAAWLLACVALLDASLLVAAGGSVTLQQVGIAGAVHAVCMAVFGTVVVEALAR